ncbi:MAG: hypothetical protein HF967_03900 [Methanosarcinales archaeon]|nr:hypothetical protein [Methanosarcinales archaeon]
MFGNAGGGCYLYKLINGIKRLNFKDVCYGGVVLYKTACRFIFKKNSKNHFVTFKYLNKIANDYGMTLSEIKTEPNFNYEHSYLGATYVFSLKGVKK